ncbi:hypothetical protein DWU89_18700 [Parabacteroides acidifaciens]|uniref:Uncharacterized protein n=1 Tax=Parabacteroides acidifaciens TaxID=2290935 RepID=A0A3D8H9C9_9BACT|nr:hypothetical protein DWU89_18700 [Parabacteroides acidifaciens]
MVPGLIRNLTELNYLVPALRRGIAEEQALSKLVNDDLGCGRLFCDPASERENGIAHYFLVLDLLLIEKYTLTPCFDCFSISSEILIDFGLTLFTILAHSDDNRENEVPSPSPKAYNLIIENRKYRQSDKP